MITQVREGGKMAYISNIIRYKMKKRVQIKEGGRDSIGINYPKRKTPTPSLSLCYYH
jgi:hypothetical protein